MEETPRDGHDGNPPLAPLAFGVVCQSSWSRGSLPRGIPDGCRGELKDLAVSAN